MVKTSRTNEVLKDPDRLYWPVLDQESRQLAASVEGKSIGYSTRRDHETGHECDPSFGLRGIQHLIRGTIEDVRPVLQLVVPFRDTERFRNQIARQLLGS